MRVCVCSCVFNRFLQTQTNPIDWRYKNLHLKKIAQGIPTEVGLKDLRFTDPP